MTTVATPGESPQAPYSPPTTPDGKTDWDALKAEKEKRDAFAELYWDTEEKRAKEARQLELVKELRLAREAEAEKERIKAGAPVANRDAEFAFRTPRDVLRKAVPPRYDFEDVPRLIGETAYYYSQATGHDQSGVIVACVTAAASVIDDEYRLVVRPESNWTVSARLWAFLCGNAAAGKSPSIRAATDPIKEMHNVLYQRWLSANAGVKKDEQEPPPALYTSDTTVAALSEALIANPRGLLMLTEEFSSWVGAIDAADKGDAAKNRGDWLQLRDGGARQVHRILRGSVYVPNWGVSVLAACTPGGLSKQMKQMPEDGLIQRFIPCILANPNLDAVGDARQALTTWGQRLEWAFAATTTDYIPQHLHFTPAARALFDAEDREIRKLVMATDDFSPGYAAHLGKHPGMLAEVALVFHVFGTAPGQQPTSEVGEEAVARGIRFMRKVRRHAYTLYSTILSSAPAFELAQAIARSIVASEVPITTIGRDWMTQHCQGFKKADDRLKREAVQFLEDADWLMAETRVRTYAGWPSKYLVHPKVFAIFAREGEEWRARRAAVKDAIAEGI